jgi:hypothetical protein
MRVSRKDNSLNDMIELLDDKFLVAQSASKTELEAIPRAWESLLPDELTFIDREIDRCITDRRYYLENYHIIRNERGGLQTIYPALDQQEILYEALDDEWSKKGCARLIILKPRQATGTTWSAGVVYHNTIFVPNAYSLCMAQDDRVSLEIFTRLMDAYHQLPFWLRPDMASKQQGLHVIYQRTDESRRAVDPGLGSTLLVSNAQKSTGVAIGRTIRNIHGSEVSRWPDASVWTADIKPSLNAPDMLGLLESTAYGRSGLFWNMWRAAESGKSIWRAVFIPVYKVRKYFIPVLKSDNFQLTIEEKALRDSVRRKDDFVIPMGFFKWRRAEIIEATNATGSDETHFESYPVTPGEAFISSGFCAFPRKELNRQQRENCEEPAEIGEIEFTSLNTLPVLRLHPPTPEETLEKPERINRFWVWERPEPDSEAVEYYLAADVGGSGEGNDFSDAVIYKLGYGHVPDIQVAEWHGRINASHFAKVIAAMAHWYHDAEVAVEYAKDGITTGNELQWVIDFPNLYRWKRLDRIGNTLTLHTHWITNAQTRDDAINRMGERLLDHTIVIRNRHALEEMRDFGRYEGETKAAGIDNNDDMVLAHLICIAAANQSGKRQAMAESMAMGTGVSSGEASTLMPKAPLRYAVYDNYNRQVCEVDSEQEGLAVIKKCEDKYHIKLLGIWRIVPVVVSKANTVWSPIHDARGAESELYNYGVDPKKMLPGLVQDHRSAMAKRYGVDPNAPVNASAPRVSRVPSFARVDDGYEGEMVGDDDY